MAMVNAVLSMAPSDFLLLGAVYKLTLLLLLLFLVPSVVKIPRVKS